MTQPALLPALQSLLAPQTAGSPVDPGLRWTNRSPRELAEELQAQGFAIGADALRRLLVQELGLARRQAFKDESAQSFPQRDAQFRHIAKLRAGFERRGWPVISIDTKKKEILGNFFRPGRAYTDGRLRVQDHDFVTAEQRLVPYGVYDPRANEGFLYLATGPDTSELACDAIWRWWQRLGRRHYRYAPRMLVLCDCGGSNGYRRQRFKQDLCDLAVDLTCDLQVAHYPPGCSKYNPIEHRLFCHVTRSLQAVVLKTIHVAQTFIARTTTACGLRVVAEIADRVYEKGRKATSEFLHHNPILPNLLLPQLNYTAPWLDRYD